MADVFSFVHSEHEYMYSKVCSGLQKSIMEILFLQAIHEWNWQVRNMWTVEGAMVEHTHPSGVIILHLLESPYVPPSLPKVPSSP